MRKKNLKKRDVVVPLSTDMKRDLHVICQAGQLTKLTPILWVVMELKKRGVSKHFYLLTEVGRALWTNAYKTSIKKSGIQNPFAWYDGKTHEWKPYVGQIGYNDEQEMFYGPQLWADLVRQMKRLGFISVLAYPSLPESQCPLALSEKDRNVFLYEDRYNRIEKLTKEYPFRPPDFMRKMRIGQKSYEKILRYAEQIAFIRDSWDELIDMINWSFLLDRSETVQKFWPYFSEEWKEIIGFE